jgi:hypothetical protein
MNTTKTTEECKSFISDISKSLNIPSDGWKRISKKQTGDGILRIFIHTSGIELPILELQSSDLCIAPSWFIQSTPVKELTSKSIKSALLWRDAMMVIGGKKAINFNNPDYQSFSWKQFLAAYNDFSGNGSKDDIEQLTNQWIQDAKNDPAAVKILFDGVSWCFDADPEAAEKDGYWSTGDGARCAVWPTDAPNEFGSNLGNPMDISTLENSHEGVYIAGVHAQNGAEAISLAFNEMTALGAAFSMEFQKKFNTNAEHDPLCPLDIKVSKLLSPNIRPKRL